MSSLFLFAQTSEISATILKMPKMDPLDWVVLVLVLLVCFVPALFFIRRSGKSTSEFFASGRSVPWWLIGISLVATTFASDTPNLVTNFVRTDGVAGNWVWWAFTLTGVATVFFYARLWRRSNVLTDLEFYEVRYSGKEASIVRGFRAIYLGLFFNCIIMANVNLAACKIANVLFGFEYWQTLLLVGALNLFFAVFSGLWGILIIDLFQFIVMMTGAIAMAYYAVNNEIVTSLGQMLETVTPMTSEKGASYVNMLPSFSQETMGLAVAIFIMPLAVQWWSVWYPGAEPGGGSYVAQRMLASRSEKDALGGTLFFNVAHYVLRPWPWIIVALASIIVFPTVADIQAQFPHVDPNLLGHDMAYPAMMIFLPVGFFGLMIAALIAANSSTILTHLNWGASYCVHDFYRIFLVPNQTEKHYVWVGRFATLIAFLFSCVLVFYIADAKAGFNILLQIGAGTGLLYLIRWFWWRINAWCEIVAMVVSFLVSALFVIGDNVHWWCFDTESAWKLGEEYTNILVLGTHERLIITVLITTIAWLLAAFFAPGTNRETLIDFYKKVKPAGWGWEPIRKAAGVSIEEVKATGDNIPLALLGWSCGSAMIWSSLFLVGNILYGRTVFAVICGVVFVLSSLVVIRVVNKLWK